MFFRKVRTAALVILPACVTTGLLSAQSLAIVSSQNLPPASVSVGYPPIQLRATGGTPPYTWSALPNSPVLSLPPGMSVSADGVLSGQPSNAGQFTPTLRVTDAAGTSAFRQFAIVAAPGASLVPHAGVIAQVAAGAGWDTTIYLVNTSPTTYNTAIVSFHNDTGAQQIFSVTASQQDYPVSGPTSSLTFILKPAATIAIHTTDPPTAALTQGWADIAASLGISSYAIFRKTLPSGLIPEGTSGQQGNFQPSLVVPFDNTSGNVTAVGLVSLSTAPAFITATAWDENGNMLGTPVPLPGLNPLGHMALDLTMGIPVTAGRRGSVRFDNSTPDSLSGLVLSFSPNSSFTSVPTLSVPPM